MVLEKTLESPLDCKEIKPINPKGNQSCLFTGRTDAEAEAPILWPPHATGQVIGKDADAGKDWGQEEKEATEDEMIRWHHWLNGLESEQGDNEGQGSLACCDPWDCEESDMTQWLNNKKILPPKILHVVPLKFQHTHTHTHTHTLILEILSVLRSLVFSTLRKD